MMILIATGVFALIFGFLFLFSPATITKMAEWSNRMVARTDFSHFPEKASGRIPGPCGAFHARNGAAAVNSFIVTARYNTSSY